MAEREADIRQLVQARHDRGVARGEPPLDVEAEVDRLMALDPAAQPEADQQDAALREEVRQLVIARNERRADARRAAARRRGRGGSSVTGSHLSVPSRALWVYNAPMASDSHPLDEIVTRPGVYFNPQTEVLIVVDDSAEIDGEIFNMEDFEGADWVTVSDEVPIDEARRDELLLAFQTHYHPGDARSISLTANELEEEADDEPDDQEVGRED